MPRRGQNSTAGPAGVEKATVNKAVATIAAMGLAGCILLAIAMHQLADQKDARRGEGPAEVLQRRFAARTVGPIRVHEEQERDGRRVVANVTIPTGTENPTIGAEIGAELQRLVAASSPPPFEVVVEVRSAGSSWTQRAVVPMAKASR